MHILIVEDERTLCETIVRSLRRLAYSVDFCYDGNEALNLLAVEKYDLVLLDLNLPGADGMTVLRQLRQTDKDTRVLILSARSEVSDKVAGLDAGASDYLSKPFHLEELEARIRSLTLRKFTQNDVVLSCGDLSFDTKSRTASVRGQELTLTRKEIGILEYLLLLLIAYVIALALSAVCAQLILNPILASMVKGGLFTLTAEVSPVSALIVLGVFVAILAAICLRMTNLTQKIQLAVLLKEK